MLDELPAPATAAGARTPAYGSDLLVDLLRALGIEPAAEGNRQVVRDIREHLATMRQVVLGDGDPRHTGVSE